MFSPSLSWVLAVSLLASLSEGRPGSPSLIPEARQIDFGQVLIGSSVARTLLLRSRYGPVTVKSAFLDGGQRLSFALSYRARGTEVLVGAGHTMDVSLAFSPVRASHHKTRLIARMTEGDSTGFPVVLTGAGTFRISELDGVRLIGGPATGPLSLGTARAGDIVRGSLAVHNTGMTSTRLVIDHVDPRSGFTVDTADIIDLAPGARADIAVRFVPRRRGPHLAALVLRDRDGRRLGMTLSGGGR